MKKYAWIVLVGFVLIIIASCVVPRPAFAPPPAKKEVHPAKPGPNYVWISGHWRWTGSRYVWASGHWTKRKAGKVWVPGHWKKVGRRWVWKSGHWK